MTDWFEWNGKKCTDFGIHVIMNQNLRTEDNENDSLIILEDVEDYLADEGIDIHGSRQGTRRIGFV